MSSYTFAHPAALSPAKVQFIENFYRVSDSRDVDQYLGFLTTDVDFIMGVNAVKGEAAVRKIRETMWGGVETRQHEPEKVYLGDEHGNELMLHGTVTYGLRNGKTVEKVGWAARMVFAEGDALKMARYQDAAPLGSALKEQAAEESK
ncbi:hypothetical protein JCM5296_003930 [Sporobolomyces johnsonii]